MSKLIVWDDKFSVGVELIDNHHKVLFELANDLHIAYETGAPTEIVDTLFQVITNFTHVHFDTEEDVLERDDSHLLHSNEHYRLIKQLNEYLHDFRNSRQGETDPGTFLKDWLLDHITRTDIPAFKRQQIDINQLGLVDSFEEFTVDESDQRKEQRVRAEQFDDEEIIGHCFNATKSKSCRATINDISPTGVKLSSDTKLDIDDLLMINCKIGRNFRLEEKLRIKNIDQEGKYGAQFISPKGETKSFLKELQGAVRKSTR